MSSSVSLVTVEDIARAYDFGPSHPLRPERVLITYELIEQIGLPSLAHVTESTSRSATDEEILAAHDQDFVQTVKGIDAGTISERSGLAFGLGTPDDPIFDGMHRASAAVCGASITAVEAVVGQDKQHAFNPAGGLHHARRREASGFCIYNDPAVAIAKALQMQPAWRVLYLDVDVHHGDGVQWIFYDDPRVLTVSFHQSGRTLYPGTGFTHEIGEGAGRGCSVNVPLQPLTGEADYLFALEAVLPSVAEAFEPDLIVTQLGADTHWNDPLANLGLTMRAYPAMARLIHSVAHEYARDRWVATGGGGYQAETVVPKVWTIHFAEMCGAAEAVPADWLSDRPSDEVSRSYRDDVARTVAEVLDACLGRLQDVVGGVKG